MMCGLVFAMAIGQLADSRPVGNDSELISAIAGAFENNREKFAYGKILYDSMDGLSRNADSAKEGKIDEKYSADSIYCFNERHVICSRVFTIEAMLATSKVVSPTQQTGRLISFRGVTDGSVTLFDQPGIGRDGKSMVHGVVIAPGVEFFFGLVDLLPLDLGFPKSNRRDLARTFQKIRDGSNETTLDSIDEAASYDGVSVVKVVTSNKYAKNTYYIDMDRGAIPLATHHETKQGEKASYFRGDIKLVPGHGWLPFIETLYLSSGRTKRIEIKSVDFDRVPTPKEFQLEFPQPIGMVNSAVGRSYKPRKIWSLDDLPSASSPEAAVLGHNAPLDPAEMFPGERIRRPRYFTVAGIVLSICIIGALVKWYRDRIK